MIGSLFYCSLSPSKEGVLNLQYSPTILFFPYRKKSRSDFLVIWKTIRTIKELDYFVVLLLVMINSVIAHLLRDSKVVEC